MQLHKRDLVDAATAILDNFGIADLTMRRLARELSVSPGALYWHFANKQQLLGAVADRILAPALQPDPSGTWREQVSGDCHRLRDALLSHTDGAELVSASFAAGMLCGSSITCLILAGSSLSTSALRRRTRSVERNLRCSSSKLLAPEKSQP